jgi:hypothetical protein
MKYAAAFTLAGGLALAASTPSQARYWHHGWHNGAAIGAGIAAGALIGAAAANANNGYYYDGYGPGYYEPDYAYAPAPGYYGPRYYHDYGSSNGNCTVSPGTGNYTPCYTAH